MCIYVGPIYDYRVCYVGYCTLYFVLNLHFGEFEVFCNSSDFVSLLYWFVCATDFATVTLFMF